MKKLGEVDHPDDPLKRVMRDFLHVEWCCVDDLRDKIRSSELGLDIDALRKQFLQLISNDEVPLQDINDLTANEFEDAGEVKKWAEGIYRRVFDVERS
ncbi:hypothetical protein [Tahibacter soli]|uniref:CdiI immunity protein domain-containing protein n=1 Tax=Tahibacter soli TaxID=2983605 RepID=A0A9X3YN05_9GAMM|nr:hypothetical protein [Tahibacter soli]MDC8013733.1 hypothetical protein [Tahibacter soli]